MTYAETVALRFDDAARRCALSTRLLADIGVIEPADLAQAQRRRRAAGAARRLGVNREEG